MKLPLKELITSAADDIFIMIIFNFYFPKKIKFGISWESSAGQTFHMEAKSYFLLKIIKELIRIASAADDILILFFIYFFVYYFFIIIFIYLFIYLFLFFFHFS